MKITALVLFSFCVAHTMASHDTLYSAEELRMVFDAAPIGKMNLPKFLEELREIAHNLELRIYQEIEEFHEEAKEIYANVMAVAEKALQQADRYLEKFVLGAINYIESLSGEHVHECLEGRREQLLEILANTRSALRECLASTENKFEDFKSQVASQIALILGDADQLKDILQKCLSEENLLEQVKCMFDSIEEIRRITLELIYKVRDALVATSSEYHKLASDLKECFAKVLEDARQQVREVVEEVKDCLQHGPPTTTVEPTTGLPEALDLY